MFFENSTRVNFIMQCNVVLLAVFITVTSPMAHAKPVLKIKTDYYTISGDSADALRQQINIRSSARENGKTYDAYTRWHVNWQYNWAKTESYCSLTAVTTNVDVTITLPKWLDHDSAPAALKKQWDHYYTALVEHENGHKDFGLKAANAIELAFSGMGRDSCSSLQRDANSTGQKILNKYTALEKQYDIDTDHGMNDGAVFP
jgi:predicted secreted Zn-dependent protease